MSELQNESWDNNNVPSSSDHHNGAGADSSDKKKKKHRSRSRDGLGHSSHHKSGERSRHRGLGGKQGSSRSLKSKSRSRDMERSRSDRSLASITSNKSSRSGRSRRDRSKDSLKTPSSRLERTRSDRSLASVTSNKSSRSGRSRRDRSKESLGGSRSTHGSSGDLSLKSYSSNRSKHSSSGDLSVKSYNSGLSSISGKQSTNTASTLSPESRKIKLALEDLGLTHMSDKSSKTRRAREDAEAKKRGRRDARSRSPVLGAQSVDSKRSGRSRSRDELSKKSRSGSRATTPGVENVSGHSTDKGREKAKRSERPGVENVSSHRDKGREKAKRSERPGIENVSSHRDKGREKARRSERPGIENVSSHRDKGSEKARRADRSRPGVETASSNRDRGREKEKRSHNERSITLEKNSGHGPTRSRLEAAKSRNNAANAATARGIDPEPLSGSNDLPLAATVADDTGNEEVFEQRVQEAVDRMMKNNTQRDETTDGDNSPGVAENSRFRARDRMFVFVVVVLIVLVGGGLGFFFLWRENMTDAEPAPAPLQYEPPSEEECQAIREQKPVTGQDGMVVVHLTFEIEVVFSEEDDFDAYFAGLVTAVQKMLVPELAGCTKPNRRAVEQRKPSHRLRRKLQEVGHPYPIANADVSAEKKIDESCSGFRESQSPSIAPTTSLEPTASPSSSESDPSFVRPPTAIITSSPPSVVSETCRRGALNLVLFIKKDADASVILPVIEDVFEVDGEQSLVEKLDLAGDGYQEIKFVGGADIAFAQSESPSSNPSNSPTVFVKYPPPDQEECQRLANGLPPLDADTMEARNFDVDIDLGLSSADTDIASVLPELEQKVQEWLVPLLVGCPVQRRFLNETTAEDYDTLTHTSAMRQLQTSLANIRYVVASVEITIIDQGQDCVIASSAPKCGLVRITLTIILRGDERNFNVVVLLSDFFPTDEDLKDVIGFSDVVDMFIARAIRATSPTTSPSARPSEKPSVVPTAPPTIAASSNPTFKPVGATTKVPTKAPTLPDATPSPTKTASAAPTLAPTPTPPPTLPDATASPTKTASSSPTDTPSRSPSKTPSQVPTITSSMAPSSQLPPGPTLLSTPPPSSQLSASPSISLSDSPSSSPSQSPSSSPSQSLSAVTNPPTTAPPTKAPTTEAPSGAPTTTDDDGPNPTAPPGSFCCSSNFKDCFVSGWCGESQSRCENECFASWIEVGSCSTGIAPWGECTDSPASCCAPATCQGDVWYKQCA